MHHWYATKMGRICVVFVCCLVGIGTSACSVPGILSEPFEHSIYKDILERQAEGMPVEEDKLQNLPPMTAKDYESLGDAYLSRNEVDQAQSKYEGALALDPSAWQLHYKIGLLMLKSGYPRDSLSHFDAILSADPMSALGHEGKGRALLALGEHEQAEVALRRAIDLDSGLWKAHEALGVLYDRLGDFDESIVQYRAALAVRRDDPQVLNNLGMAFFLKKDYPKAIDAFERALSFTPEAERARTYNNLGRAYAKTGSHARAFESFRRASNVPTAYNNLGLLYLEDGRFRQAATCFEKAIVDSPSYYAAANENLVTAKLGFSQADTGEGVSVAASCP